MLRRFQSEICQWLVPCILMLSLSNCCRLPAQETAGTESATAGNEASESSVAESPASTGPEEVLGTKQESVADRFSRLEELLLRSSELEAVENPGRAALLQQAAQLGKQAQLADLLVAAAKSLKSQQFTEAIEKQKSSRESLVRLLELLQSENRDERVRDQRDQVRRWLEETDRLLRLQGSLRGRTEGGQDAQQAAGDQGRLANKAADIASELKSDNEPESQATSDEKDSAESRSGDQPPDDSGQEKSGDKKSAGDARQDSSENAGDSPSERGESGKNGSQQPGPDGKEADAAQREEDQGKENQSGKPSEQEQGNSESDAAGDPKKSQQPGDSQQGQSQEGQSQEGQSHEGQSQQGQSQEGQSQPGQSQQGQNPQQPQDPTERARQRIQQAQQKMKEAQEDLENSKRDGAIEKQREAEEKLREAIEQLEEILRQLREEEIERSLASLESRLRRMLDMQTKVLVETQRLNEISGDENTSRQVEIRASNLSLDERKILAEGERAYLLLREEGSSAAFPEAIVQLNLDIAKVLDRLSQADVGKLTIFIEQEIVSSLEEMVEALVQVQKENKERKQQQQSQQPPGQPGEQPLVNKLAEIRLIKTLQLRINKRTDALAQLLDDPSDTVGQVESSDVLSELKSLSERQASIQTVTQDIVIGKGE